VIGVRAVHGWTWQRAFAAFGAAVAIGVVVVAVLYALAALAD
jgi:hypothetical protein